jgi:hypothetical protein
MTGRPIVRLTCATLLLLSAAGAGSAAQAQGGTSLSIVVQNGQFSPQQLRTVAGSPVTLKVTNLDATPVEFASSTLRVDRMISPNTGVTMQIGALPRGRYTFFDLAHAGTQGTLVLD